MREKWDGKVCEWPGARFEKKVCFIKRAMCVIAAEGARFLEGSRKRPERSGLGNEVFFGVFYEKMRNVEKH